MSKKRIQISNILASNILIACKRRCCLCYFLLHKKYPKRGQIAHINHDPNDNEINNLVYLCLDHHDEYDSKTSQSKGLTALEVLHYREKLYKILETSNIFISTEVMKQVQIKKQNKSSVRLEELKFLDLPWKPKFLEEGKPLLFAFKSPNGYDGVCRIEKVDLGDDRVMLICEDIDENTGNSTTNCIEYIALQLCERFEINPNKLLLVEHYRLSYMKYDEWNLVDFKERSLIKGFTDPIWNPMLSNDWKRLGLRPRKKPSFGFHKSSLLVQIK